MGEPARQTNSSLKDIMRADNSDDDVQLIETIPSKTQKSTIHSMSSAQKQTKPHEDIDDGPDLEIITGTFNKSPIPSRVNDGNKKTGNSASKATNNSNRKPEAAKTQNFQHVDDKSKKPLFAFLDLKPKNPVNAYTDLGNNQLLLMMMQNQPQMSLNANFGLGNLNYHNYIQGIPQNKMNMFPQEYNPFQALMLFPDAANLYGQQNAQAFFANNMFDKVSRINQMGLSSMEDPRLSHTQLAANAVQENQQNRAAMNQKNFNGASASDNHVLNHSSINHNHEASMQKHTAMDEAEPSGPSNTKATEDDANTKRKRTRTCFNPCCQTDPTDSNLWSKVRVMGKMSCKVCEEAWKKQQYCYFCKQVYIEDGEGYSDSKPWIDCDICKRWTHTECEEKHIQREIKLQEVKEEGNVEYNCPSCRSKAKGPGRNKVKRASPTPHDTIYPQRNAPERPSHDELEQSSVRKQIKLMAETIEDKPKEINTSTNLNAMVVEETCIAKKKLENMFNKHIQKRKLQPVKPVIGYNTYAIVDNLLAQHSKKLQLTDNELNHDLHLMREYAGKVPATDKYQFVEDSPEPNTYDHDTYNGDEGKKSGPRTLRNRGREGNSRRTARSELNMSENFDEETGSEYASVTHSKRNTRTRRKVE